MYEVRDSTDLKPTGRKDWWLELPQAQAGRDAWADRATRRKRRETYRLAFVPTKCRIDEEPEPRIVEINLPKEGPWSLRDVTDDVTEEAQATAEQTQREKAERREKATAALIREIDARPAAAPLLRDRDAVGLLLDCGLKRAEARSLLAEKEGVSWRTEPLRGHRGNPKALFRLQPRGGENGGGNNAGAKDPGRERLSEAPVSAAQYESGRRKLEAEKPAPEAGASDGGLFPPTLTSPARRGPGGPLQSNVLAALSPAEVAELPGKYDYGPKELSREGLTELAEVELLGRLKPNQIPVWLDPETRDRALHCLAAWSVTRSGRIEAQT